MSAVTTSTVRSLLAGVMAIAVVLAVLLAVPDTARAQATPADPTVPSDVGDAVALALAWSALIPDGSVDTVLLGTTRSFADSLAAGGVQALDAGGPLLLHDEGTVLDARVADEIDRLGASRVVILGGTAAISEEVATTLEDDYDVERVAGPGRRETAVETARRFFDAPAEAIVVRADGDADVPTRGFIDALGAGTLSGTIGAPILLNSTATLDDVVRDYLQATPSITEVTIVGGNGAISRDTEQALRDLDLRVSRSGGATRHETAALVALDVRTATSPSEDGRRPLIIDGNDDLAWASGLPASFHGNILLLANGDDATAPTIRTVLGVQNQDDAVRCGPLVSTTACAEARAAEDAMQFDSEVTLLETVLDGYQEVPAVATDAWGTAGLWVGPDYTCVQATVAYESGPLTGFHLHAADRGDNGDVVIPFSTEEYLFDLADCATGLDTALAQAIATEPSDFYLNMHTEANPSGEIRGQAHALADDLFSSLAGDQVVPAGTGLENRGGVVRIDRPEAGLLCWTSSANLSQDRVTSLTVHDGAEGENGPAVIDLDHRSPEDGYGRCLEVDPNAADALFADPEAHYVLLSTENLPNGAIRGQLR